MEKRREPVWIPYSTPPQSGRERVAGLTQRYGFPALCLALLAALGALLFYTSARPDGLPSDEELARLADQLAARTEGRRTYKGNATLTIATLPSDAVVFIDQEPSGISPMQRFSLPAGVHRITIQKEGYVLVDSIVAVRSDRPEALYVPLREAPAPTDAPPRPAIAQQRPAERSSRNEGGTAPGETAPGETAPGETAPGETAPGETAPGGTAPGGTAPGGTAPGETAPVEGPVKTNEAGQASTGEAAPRGALRLTSQPSGAAVQIDGRAVGTTPLTVQEVPPGSHAVTMQADAHRDFARRVPVRPGETQRVAGQLAALEGTLRVLARPWGTISIDGTVRRRETDVRYVTALPAGLHRLTVTHPVLGTWEQEVEVPAGDTSTFVVDFNEAQPGALTASGGAPAKAPPNE